MLPATQELSASRTVDLGDLTRVGSFTSPMAASFNSLHEPKIHIERMALRLAQFSTEGP